VSNQGEGQGESYGSAIDLITATENSVNTAYVDLTTAMDDGPRKVVKMANAMGIPRNAPGLKPFPAVALGSLTASPIDMANAYATIANGGVRHDWFTVKKVSRASDKKVLYKAPKKTKRVLPGDIASDVSYALQQTVQNGTATTALELGRPAAAKTGTATNDDGDVSSSWFVGYTPQVATAVMYARGKGNEPLNGYLPVFYGGAYPAATWTAVMQALMEGVEIEEFPEPAFVDGEAPSEGHAPYTPPPEPTPTPSPKQKPKQKPKPQPTSEPASPEPSQAPTQDPGNDGGGDGGGGDGGGGGPGNPRETCDPSDPTCSP
jgi:membrane peptidoglycan carboxypeptidase